MLEQKKGQIKIFAKNIRGNASGGILEESRYTRNIAGGRHFQNGKGGGVNNGSNQQKTILEETRVKTIECVDELDDGSANDGSRTNTQKGVLFNKEYIFKVKEYTNGDPRNPNSVKWIVSYTDPDNEAYTENILTNKNSTGNQISIKFSSNSYCGRNLEIIAYIESKEYEGKYPLFMHNRFRWFDGKIIEDELNIRVGSKMPWIINQSGTSLCGMACIFYLFAKEQPEQYKWFSKLLFRTGEVTYNKYTVKPTNEFLEKEIDNGGFPKDTANMPLVDFITLAGTRNADNNSYKGGNEEFQAINWPSLMTNLSEKLLGFDKVDSNGIYKPIKKGIDFPLPFVWKIIEYINQQIADGYRIILMIDSDLIAPDPDTLWNLFALEYHWVVLESPIQTIQNLNGDGKLFYTIDFKVYTWGTKDQYLKQTITLEHFRSNYYGYIKVK